MSTNFTGNSSNNLELSSEGEDFYSSLDSETRSLKETYNPLCEVFPKVVACNYWRWGRGGNQELKNAICIIGNNIINEKVSIISSTFTSEMSPSSQLFVVLWVWHCVLILLGVFRLLTRVIQLSSADIRSVSLDPLAQ